MLVKKQEVAQFLPYVHLQELIHALQQAGYSTQGPLVRDGAIVYDVLEHAEQLPWGIREHQTPGEYRLEVLEDKKAFAFANGPQALKPVLFKPRETVWRVERDRDGKLQFRSQMASEPPIAFIGARACDIAAMVIQDKVFLAEGRTDIHYQHRRASLFVVGVNCGYASQNCFCVSAGSGPEITQPFDILMTEIDGGFVVKSGSERGAQILSTLLLKPAGKRREHAAQIHVENAANMQTKRIPLDNKRALRDVLFANLNHERWDEVAERCLSCGNCTAVCPTCFCHSEVEKPALDGQSSEHSREWDSCFTDGHSELAGRPLRETTSERYRQWLTHKVGSWFDQFGTSGCVGCGRCVTWCPVGIDITEELAAISGESNERGEA
ncbi:sulfite reductase subunit A [Legionella geestiana]|nr:4Fe-4S dicluster domain-containing protein [Legionella geestiana]QBS13112.1 sulfite reductase subunit A [Legionella geestiana]